MVEAVDTLQAVGFVGPPVLPQHLSGYRCRLSERPNGHSLVVHDVENGIQPGDLHQIVNLIREDSGFLFLATRLRE
jgi:hypothetical protein